MVTYVEEVKAGFTTPHNAEMLEELNLMIERDSFINSKGRDEQTYLGLKKALTRADERNFVVVFSDEPGNVTDSDLKKEVIDLTKNTNSKVFFLMRPHKTTNGPQSPEEALQEMKDNFDEIGTVIDIEHHNPEETLDQILDELVKSQICEGDDDTNGTTTTDSFITTTDDGDDGTTTDEISEITTTEPLPPSCHIKVIKLLFKYLFFTILCAA